MPEQKMTLEEFLKLRAKKETGGRRAGRSHNFIQALTDYYELVHGLKIQIEIKDTYNLISRLTEPPTERKTYTICSSYSEARQERRTHFPDALIIKERIAIVNKDNYFLLSQTELL